MRDWRRLARSVAAPLLWGAGLVAIGFGNVMAGLAFIVGGWFVRVALRTSERRAALASVLDGVTVGEVMETAAYTVAPQATLETFAEDLEGVEGATVARVMHDGELLGLLGTRELARVPRKRWPTVHAREAMVPAADLPVLDADDPLRPAVARLGSSAAPGFPVVADGRLAGVLTRLAVGRALHERSQAEGEPGAAEPPESPSGADA
jgi:CBS domain-containing protein